jgi:hypothetical protein
MVGCFVILSKYIKEFLPAEPYKKTGSRLDKECEFQVVHV